MSKPATETDFFLEAHDDKIRDTVEKQAEVARLANLVRALDLAQNLEEVSDDHRKAVFISQVSFEELDRLYKFLWRFIPQEPC